MIPAALFGAEVTGTRAVILMHGPYMIPRRDVPPIGTGFMPARGGWAVCVTYSPRGSRPPSSEAGCRLNRARAEFRLAPVRDLPDLVGRADRILVCSSPGYGFGSGSIPANVRYVGPQLDDDTNVAFDDPWAGSPPQPLVLVGLSSTVMRQEGLLQRAADALGQAQVHGLVTTGLAVDPAVISAPPNVRVTRWGTPRRCAPRCAAVITHGGHGTVMKALITGVLLVVVPLGRGQPDNAARVVHAGASIRLRKGTSVSTLRAAVAQVIEDSRYRAAAAAMAARLAAERDDSRAVDELEQVAAGIPAGERRTALDGVLERIAANPSVVPLSETAAE